MRLFYYLGDYAKNFKGTVIITFIRNDILRSININEDETLRTMLKKDLKNAGFKLKENIEVLSREELEKLLTYFYDDESVLSNIMDYCTYA